MVHLEEVFRRLREADVKLNPKKCRFVKQEVEYLDTVVLTPRRCMSFKNSLLHLTLRSLFCCLLTLVPWGLALDRNILYRPFPHSSQARARRHGSEARVDKHQTWWTTQRSRRRKLRKISHGISLLKAYQCFQGKR